MAGHRSGPTCNCSISCRTQSIYCCVFLNRRLIRASAEQMCADLEFDYAPVGVEYRLKLPVMTPVIPETESESFPPPPVNVIESTFVELASVAWYWNFPPT